MPRLSLWRENKGHDYRFFDRRISEMFTIGGVGIYLHKYLGPKDQSSGLATSTTQGTTGPVLNFSDTSTINLGQFVAGTGIPANTTVVAKDASTITLSASTTVVVPSGTNVSFYDNATQPPPTGALNSIQDLLFLENRDNKYDSSIYTLRTIYRINDNDFDLTQFGLFLTGDTLFAVFHLNDMIETLGRKIMAGDVIEMPHLADFYPLDEDLPTALKRFYVVQEATRAAEGFAPTWYPHLWRVKLAPLVDSQEYKDITDKIKGDGNNGNSMYDKFIEINDAIIAQAESNVLKSGYDTTSIYHVPVTESGYPGDPSGLDASNALEDASESLNDASSATLSPDASVTGYMTGDGIPPNANTVAAGIEFPTSPTVGDFYLRLDFVPNRLFRFDGKRWVKMEDSVRTYISNGPDNESQRSTFVNNTNKTFTNLLTWDSIRVADPYTPPAGSITSSFTLLTKTVITTIPYIASYGVKTILNGRTVDNIMSNSSGNVAFTTVPSISSGDVLEYRIYEKSIAERQALSTMLTPKADN